MHLVNNIKTWLGLIWTNDGFPFTNRSIGRLWVSVAMCRGPAYTALKPTHDMLRLFLCEEWYQPWALHLPGKAERGAGRPPTEHVGNSWGLSRTPRARVLPPSTRSLWYRPHRNALPGSSHARLKTNITRITCIFLTVQVEDVIHMWSEINISPHSKLKANLRRNWSALPLTLHIKLITNVLWMLHISYTLTMLKQRLDIFSYNCQTLCH